jgi:hypothetical protein
MVLLLNRANSAAANIVRREEGAVLVAEFEEGVFVSRHLDGAVVDYLLRMPLETGNTTV